MLQASSQALLGGSLSNARYATLPTQLTNGSKTEKISRVLIRSTCLFDICGRVAVAS